MDEKELTTQVRKANKMANRIKKLHEIKPKKWLLGFKLVLELKGSAYKGETINEDTFLGIPYLIDYKEPFSLLIATDPLEK